MSRAIDPEIIRAAEALAERFEAQVQARIPEVRERFRAIEGMLGVRYSDADVSGHALAEALGLTTLVTEPSEPADAEALGAFAASSDRLGLRAVAVEAPSAGLVLLPELHWVLLIGSEGDHAGEDLGYLASIFAIRFASEPVATRAREDTAFEAALAKEVWRRLRPPTS